MNDDLAQLQRLLKIHQRTALIAAIVDSAVVGSLTLVLAMTVLVACGFPLAISVIPAVIFSYFAWRRPLPLDRVAAELDHRHGLADLLGSAWAVRERNEPWAASLRSIADAQAAALPPSPSPWPGRWTVRRSACGLAMAAAALLLTQVMPTSFARAETKPPTAESDSGSRSEDSQRIADARPRAADTASSETRLPSEHPAVAKGQAASEVAPAPGHDANGDGQADSKQASSIELNAAETGMAGSVSTSGGNRMADGLDGQQNAAGVIRSKPGESAAPLITSGETTSPVSGDHRHAAPPPAAYRDLISDFFAR